jgi:nucleotide-binding universal stress UspA family protein
MPQGPVLIAFDGTPASRKALRAAAELFAPRPAVVVVVWEAGRGFELANLPSLGLDTGLAPLDLRTAAKLDQQLYDAARRLAQQGAALAREGGLAAEGRTVADEGDVADSLVQVAQELAAQVLVVGAHGHGALSELLLGSTSRAVVKYAPCPVLVVRGENEREPGLDHG